jgi:hypothetical protein
MIAVAGLGAAFTAGTVLGPLSGANAGHANSILTAALDGRSEVAGDATDRRIVGDPDGRGEFYVFGIDGDPTTLCYVLTVDRIAPASAAHIHRGAAGVAGPVVASLGAPADGNAADCLTEGETGKFPGNPPGIVAEILADPGSFYVNVHNAEHPGGAVRGQLAAER